MSHKGRSERKPLLQWLRYEDAICLHVFGRLWSYARDRNRKRPSVAFTSGIERTVADLICEAVRNDTAELIAENERLHRELNAEKGATT